MLGRNPQDQPDRYGNAGTMPLAHTQLVDAGIAYGELMAPAPASEWASRLTGKIVTPSNIAYLVNYGLIPDRGRNGSLLVSIVDLERYYQKIAGRSENAYKSKLGADLNWALSFEQYKEAETTKHIHRLHPYKGKFIPQLVEYFLDAHTDEFKTAACFAPGDIILDPFCGSGTTLAQANELGMHAIGVDISRFNAMISNLKLSPIPLVDLAKATAEVTTVIAANTEGTKARAFEDELLAELKTFNAQFFPSPAFRRSVNRGEVNEDEYGNRKAADFSRRFCQLLEKHQVSNQINAQSERFVDNWYLAPVRSEIKSAGKFIDAVADSSLRDFLRLILSRTVRSSRATTHSDLATLLKPVVETYYCGKHSKVCKPLFSLLGWWRRYAEDTVKRKAQFERLRTDTSQICLAGDSRSIDLFAELAALNPGLAALAQERKIRGIFSSPPYVGMIDYHEQHAYAYELFNLPRNDQSEIGPMRAGRGRQARQDYVDGIAQSLSNCLQYMTDDCDIFLVANDKFGLYPHIAEQSGLAICQEYKRPVLNRSEGDKGAYAETIFHLRRK